MLIKKRCLIALKVNYQYKIKHTILFFQELWFHKYLLASNFVNLMKKQILGLFFAYNNLCKLHFKVRTFPFHWSIQHEINEKKVLNKYWSNQSIKEDIELNWTADNAWLIIAFCHFSILSYYKFTTWQPFFVFTATRHNQNLQHDSTLSPSHG